jgi:hypothetical protein
MPTPAQQLALRMRDINRPLRPSASTPGPKPGLTPSSVSTPPGLNQGPVGRPPTAASPFAALPTPALAQSPPPGGAPPTPQPSTPPKQPGSEGVSKIEFARDTLADKAKAAATESESAARMARDQATFDQQQQQIAAQQEQRRQTQEFGQVPDVAKLPGAPPLPINPTGGPSFNPFTGSWTKPAEGTVTPPTKPGDPGTETRPQTDPPVPTGGPFNAPAPVRGETITSGALGPEVRADIQVPLADILRRRAAAMSLYGPGSQVRPDVPPVRPL